MKVFLDMDGVIADFTAGWCKEFNVPFSNENYPFPTGLWDYISCVETVLGIKWRDVAKACSEPNFWARLPVLPHAKFLYDSLLAAGHDVCFLTTATGDLEAVFEGKRAWLEKYGFATRHDNRMTLLECKETKDSYATPDAILIDDKDSAIQGFIKHGGNAILVPRPWNNRHSDFHHSFRVANEMVLREVRQIVEGLKT